MTTLTAYLDERKLTQRDFAEANGFNEQQVSRWITGAALPSSRNMRAIFRATEGKVTLADWPDAAE